VIELAVGPEDSVVAAFTSCWKSQLHMVHRRGCGVVILQMTRSTGSGRQAVIIVDVAIQAYPGWVGVGIR